IHISDPQQPGYLGMYKLGVRTLSGNAILMWNTPSNLRWYTLEDSSRLDTGLLAQRIHFKQLSWTDEDHPTEFWLLERPFGPGITKEADGWFGTGEHYEGTLVLRSANERGTSVAAFSFELPHPYGRVTIKVKGAVRVPNGYGEEGDPIPTKPKVVDEYDFGHEASEPQVIVPPGFAPDERVNLNGDEVDDLVITGTLEQGRGERSSDYFVRGLSPLPGTEFLMTRERWGVLGFFRLREGELLTPERLATGLRSNVYAWANADTARVFIPVLRYLVGIPEELRRWSLVDEAFDGALVYRTKEYDRPIIGTLEIIAETPGGQFGVRPQTWVEEGKVLEVR
ncbi:MAG: hypothetical protein KA791_11590, partial [Flavobacteriales bacterium]|nr:hypothetical protein [Flavobacteriales bacterium]